MDRNILWLRLLLVTMISGLGLLLLVGAADDMGLIHVSIITLNKANPLDRITGGSIMFMGVLLIIAGLVLGKKLPQIFQKMLS